MTLSQFFTRSGVLLAAAVTSASLLLGVPAAHALAKPFYKVELAEAAPAKKTIIRGVIFQCEGPVCRAPVTASAPKNVCASIAREVGQLVSFEAGDRVFSADEMASCNAKKKVIIARD